MRKRAVRTASSGTSVVPLEGVFRDRAGMNHAWVEKMSSTHSMIVDTIRCAFIDVLRTVIVTCKISVDVVFLHQGLKFQH